MQWTLGLAVTATVALAGCSAGYALRPWGNSGYPVAVGASFSDQPYAPELVVIPPGSFMMGSTEEETTREGRRADTAAFERPTHMVVLSRALAVGRFLVTRREYGIFVAATNRPAPNGCNVLDGKWQFEAHRSFADTAYPQTDLDPATCVDLEDTAAYAAWLSRRTGHAYRLLHEAEWEYAARAGTQTSRWWGGDRTEICRHANGADQSYDRTYPGDAHVNTGCDDRFVQSNPTNAFSPNPFGLYDMIGNVWEWIGDCFAPTYAAAPSDASAPITNGDCTRRVIRGGSWHNYPDALRSAARFWLPPDMRSSSVGFRLARLPDPAPPR
jgi:formylglycine-generating enzyme